MKYRAIFLSDVHLGIKYSRVDELLKFLKENECDTLYLVGDIIDGWALKRKWYWDAKSNLLIQKILRKARHGTRIVYITGNHDEFLRFFDRPMTFGNIEIEEEVVHTTANGKTYLVIHGDKFDGLLNKMDWISHIGSFLYDGVLWMSDKLSKLRRKMGMQYWSLSHVIKFKVKEAVKFMNGFETALSNEARRKQMDGVICGHIHHACFKMIDGIEYYNCGSWLEHCNVVVEHMDGRMEIINIA
jgi:UDP-2,3-diacylglucosamine pyrophosphatase LpxH